MFSHFLLKMRSALAVENISESELCAMLGKEQKWLSDSEPVPADITMRLLRDSRLQKYAMWLMINKTAPEAGQIEPALAHYTQIATTC